MSKGATIRVTFLDVRELKLAAEKLKAVFDRKDNAESEEWNTLVTDAMNTSYATLYHLAKNPDNPVMLWPEGEVRRVFIEQQRAVADAGVKKPEGEESK